MKNKIRELPQEVFAVLMSVRKERGHEYYHFTGFFGRNDLSEVGKLTCLNPPPNPWPFLFNLLECWCLLLLVNVGVFDRQSSDVVQADFELTSVSQVVGLGVCATLPNFMLF